MIEELASLILKMALINSIKYLASFYMCCMVRKSSNIKAYQSEKIDKRYQYKIQRLKTLDMQKKDCMENLQMRILSNIHTLNLFIVEENLSSSYMNSLPI